MNTCQRKLDILIGDQSKKIEFDDDVNKVSAAPKKEGEDVSVEFTIEYESGSDVERLLSHEIIRDSTAVVQPRADNWFE